MASASLRAAIHPRSLKARGFLAGFIKQYKGESKMKMKAIYYAVLMVAAIVLLVTSVPVQASQDG
jgi:hypothetical protein